MITYMKSNALEDLKSFVEGNLTPSELVLARELEAHFQAAAYKRELGRIVNTRRMELGLSQRQLAKLLGISQREVCHLEQGKSNPTLITQMKVLSALNLKLAITTS